MTTFVMPSEVFPVSMRTTGHGIAAGIGKLGAFVGVFLVPQLQKHINLRGMLLVAGAAAILGFLLTMVLPEPAGRSLEEVSGEDADIVDPQPWRIPALDATSSPKIIPVVDLVAAGDSVAIPRTDEPDQPPRTRHQEDAHLHRREAQTYRWVLPWLSPKFRPLARRSKALTRPRRRQRGVDPAGSRWSSGGRTSFSKSMECSGSPSQSCRSSATTRPAARLHSSRTTASSPCSRS